MYMKQLRPPRFSIANLPASAVCICCVHLLCPAGEYISVSSQKDAEEADIEKERLEQLKGPEARQREFEELVSGAVHC
jgi:hypothetical protein